MTTPHRRQLNRGFTLIEIVVAICISLIIGAMIAMFIKWPVDNYFAQSRRGALIIEADLIKRNLDNDIRNAVPRSVRFGTVGPNVILEMLHASDVVLYREANTLPALPATNRQQELDTTVADQQFNTLGLFNRTPCAAGLRLVVNNDVNVPARNVYSGAAVITPTATVVTCTIVNPPSTRQLHVQLSAAFDFVSPSPTHHVFLSSGPVAYVCDKNAHTLTRFTNYAITNPIAANRNAGTSALISQDINDCVFDISPATQFRSEIVSSNVQLTRTGSLQMQETMQVYAQVPVENLQ